MASRPRPVAALALAIGAAHLACSSGGDGNGARGAPVSATRTGSVMTSTTGSDASAGAVDAAPGCVAALTALKEGRLTEFTGLAGCTRADADAVFGTAAPGRPTRYPASGIASNGAELAFAGDALVRVVLSRPSLATAPAPLLGEPESSMGSRLAGATKQWIYASRGLALHYREAEQRYIAVVAFPAMTVDAYLASSLSKMEGPIRDPIR